MSTDLNQLLQRETDDLTAFPIFVAFRKEYQVSQSAITSVDLNGSTVDIDDCIFYTNEYDELEGYLEEHNYRYNNCADKLFFWNKSDEIRCDKIVRAFWTKEECDTWCEENSYMNDYYTYPIMAEGVLQDSMKFTCKREIARNSKLV